MWKNFSTSLKQTNKKIQLQSKSMHLMGKTERIRQGGDMLVCPLTLVTGEQERPFPVASESRLELPLNDKEAFRLSLLLHLLSLIYKVVLVSLFSSFLLNLG